MLTSGMYALAGAIIGAAGSFGCVFFVQKRESKALQRWMFASHFDLLQDVADCAAEYSRTGAFGVFSERLDARIVSLRECLQRDSSAGLKTETYSALYRSLSSAEYMVWASDNRCGAGYTVNYINKCLEDVRGAQMRLGGMPPSRPFSENRLMRGTDVLTVRDEDGIAVIGITQLTNPNE